jgi:hypothetical protein
MKSLILLAVMLMQMVAFAAKDNCADPNLNNMEGVDYYSELQYLTRFTKLFEMSSTAPAGFEDMFGSGNELCRDITATYLKHYDGTIYVLYTTHDDYCDGGNTIGYMINMTKYEDEDSSLAASVVAEIGDSEIYCVEATTAPAPEVSTNVLTIDEARKVEDYLNDICGDTYCGGDNDYVVSGLVCDTEKCSIKVAVASYYGDFEPYSYTCEMTEIKAELKKANARTYDDKEDVFYDYLLDNCLQ